MGRLRRSSTRRCAVAAVVCFLPACVERDGGLEYRPTHKVRIDDRHPLTEADLPGPDGVVYPDWRYAGVQGGIPTRLKVVARVAADRDDTDDVAAFEKAVAAAARAGGGIVQIGEGTFHFDRPLIITHDRIVLRGRGPDKTRIVFRYHPPPDRPTLFATADGDTWDYSSWAQIHAVPDDLQALELLVDGRRVLEVRRRAHWGGTFSAGVPIWKLLRDFEPGPHRVLARAFYGRRQEPRESKPYTIRFRRAAAGAAHRHRRPPSLGHLAAVTFAGSTAGTPAIELTQTAPRGSRRLRLKTTRGLTEGDAIVLDAPATERWNRLVGNACKWGTYRQYQFRIERISGDTVTLNQPLRLDFPVEDRPTVSLIYPIRGCGVESLTIQQTRKLWTGGVMFSTAWNGWARKLRVIKAGRFPIYAVNSKWMEFRDCEMDDAWYHGGGGTAYVGWQTCFDCLWDGLVTRKMRHAPCVQWATSGCVIRNGVFHDSDAQWHAGWTNENLFENCRVLSTTTRYGGYGYGAWSSPPSDAAHGPNGPRNVVYNCDVTSLRSGVWLGGANSGWIFVGNRFDVRKGYGFDVHGGSREHHIARNVIVLRNGRTAVQFRTADSGGAHVLNNTIHCTGGRAVAGPSRCAAVEANAVRPSVPAGGRLPPRPRLRVPSIFEWQRKHKPLPRHPRPAR